MEQLIRVAIAAAAVLVGSLVWRLTRDKIGAFAAGLLSTAAGLLVGAVIFLSGYVGQFILIRVSDDYAWSMIQKSMEVSGLDLRLLFEVDQRIEPEFRREAIALSRKYTGNRKALSDASDEVGRAIYRKYIGQRAPHGSPASVTEWGRAYLALLEKLAATSKPACGEFSLGRSAGVTRMLSHLRPEVNRMIVAAVSAYKTGDARNPVPTESAMEAVWIEMYTGAGTPFTAQDLDDLDKIETLPHPRACDLTVAVFRRAVVLSPEHRVMFFRWMLYDSFKD
ncbi:hypothetical protein FHP25_05730 [Vineibacter terrae]|uniref:Uncharacterized protein n=1 Tax=Vineibacter terrae TaxID=2586908 RepID=A0A5C8PSV1_9HYPH|nr:hypothetical protein [Vineibacter terrae]TXL79451.1 hypothetical protein FHP25_05730 [Vineibacter terrae]